MLLENISLGKTMEIFVERSGYRYKLVSKVEDSKKRRLCVSAIVANGKTFSFRNSDDITLVYRDGTELWEWKHVKAGLAKLEDSPVHFFEIKDKGHSFNRRNSYRVDINDDVKLGFYKQPDSLLKSAYIPLIEVAEDENDADEDDDTKTKIYTVKTVIEDGVSVEKKVQMMPLTDAKPTMVKAHVKNISELGVGVFSDTEFEIGDAFFTSITSPFGDLNLKAKVVRKNLQNGLVDRYNFYYGCEYIESDTRILKYIFEIQRKIIKKQKEQKEFEESLMLKRREEKKANSKENEMKES